MAFRNTLTSMLQFVTEIKMMMMMMMITGVVWLHILRRDGVLFIWTLWYLLSAILLQTTDHALFAVDHYCSTGAVV